MSDSILKKINRALRDAFKTSDRLFFFRKARKEGDVLLQVYKKAFSVVDIRPSSTLFPETGDKSLDPTTEKIYHCGVYDLSKDKDKDDYETVMSLIGVSEGIVTTRDIRWVDSTPIIFLEWCTRVTVPSLKAMVSSMNGDKDKLDDEIKSIIKNINLDIKDYNGKD